MKVIGIVVLLGVIVLIVSTLSGGLSVGGITILPLGTSPTQGIIKITNPITVPPVAQQIVKPIEETSPASPVNTGTASTQQLFGKTTPKLTVEKWFSERQQQTTVENWMKQESQGITAGEWFGRYSQTPEELLGNR